MDATDVAILRQMGYFPFREGARHPSRILPTAIAAAIGMSDDAVRNRIRRLEEDGVVVGYAAYPNLRHLGLHQVTYHLEIAGNAKSEVMSAIAALPEVGSVFDYVGAAVCVDVVCPGREGAAGALERLREVTGEVPLAVLYENLGPQVTRPLTDLDWRILDELARDGLLTAPAVAARIGVSARTARRHIDRMADEGSFDVLPVLDPSQMDGVVPVVLRAHPVQGREAEARNALRAALADVCYYDWAPPDPALGLEIMAFADGIAGAEAARRRAAAVDAVARAEALFPCGAIHSSGWLQDALAKRAGRTVAQPSSGAASRSAAQLSSAA